MVAPASHADTMVDSTMQRQPSAHPHSPRLARVVPLVVSRFPLNLPPPALTLPHPLFRAWRPSCTHLTMTRLFTSSPCHMCRRLPPWGWLYCCTQDKELSLAEGIEKGSVGPMDDLAERLTRGVKPTKKGPELRSDRFSALTELTQAELATYTPEELVIILKQREHVSVLHCPGSARPRSDLARLSPSSPRSCRMYSAARGAAV